VWPNVVETVGSVLDDRATRTAPATGADTARRTRTEKTMRRKEFPSFGGRPSVTVSARRGPAGSGSV
jgi:hypothetical protein